MVRRQRLHEIHVIERNEKNVREDLKESVWQREQHPPWNVKTHLSDGEILSLPRGRRYCRPLIPFWYAITAEYATVKSAINVSATASPANLTFSLIL